MEGVAGFCSMATVNCDARWKVGKVRMIPPMEGKAGPISTLPKAATSDSAETI